jgi:hypothetical protein
MVRRLQDKRLQREGIFKVRPQGGLRKRGADRSGQAVASGLWDADLGGGVFKQRIARGGDGKSCGFRTIILFKVGGRSFFVHGYAKNEKASAAGEIAEVTNDGEDGKQE